MTTNSPKVPTDLRSNPLARCILVSEHAIDRYIERVAPKSGPLSRPDIVARVLAMLPDAVPMTDTKFYSNGVIVTVVGSVVTTVYRPTTRSQKSKVRKALSRFRQKTGLIPRSRSC